MLRIRASHLSQRARKSAAKRVTRYLSALYPSQLDTRFNTITMQKRASQMFATRKRKPEAHKKDPVRVTGQVSPANSGANEKLELHLTKIEYGRRTRQTKVVTKNEATLSMQNFRLIRHRVYNHGGATARNPCSSPCTLTLRARRKPAKDQGAARRSESANARREVRTRPEQRSTIR